MSLKRILNELHNKIPQDLILKNLDKRFLFIELGNDIISKEIGIINNKTNNLIIKIILPNDYPFKPCNVFLLDNHYNLQSYNRWCSKLINYKILDQNIINKQQFLDNIFYQWVFASIRYPLFKKYLNIPYQGICYCCDSIICSGKWCPSYTMVDILYEYIIRKQFLIYGNSLNLRIINSIFSNNKWYIPNDVICHIISFI